MAKITRKDLEEKFGKPCIEIIPNAALPPELTPENIQAAVDCIRSVIALLRANTPTMPQQNLRLRHRVNRSNIEIIEAVAEFAANHPDTVNPTLNVESWLETLNHIRDIIPLIDEINQLLTTADNFNLVESIIAFEDFRNYYVCVKILAEKGFPEAVQIWPTMRQIYDHLRGRRGPQCAVKELIQTLHAAKNVIAKGKPVLLEALKDQKYLEEDLHKFLREEDHIVDEKRIDN